MKTKTLSWEPILRGNIYCSSACGGDCTVSEYNRVVQESDKLALKMGKGWTASVSENLGWHWQIISPCKRIQLHKERGIKNRVYYNAYLNNPGESGGRWVGEGKTPQIAIKNAFDLARKDLEGIAKIINPIFS